MAFALFAVIASFGIGNMTQGNSIAGALHSTFSVPTWVTGICDHSSFFTDYCRRNQIHIKVSSIVVPVMAIFMSSVECIW